MAVRRHSNTSVQYPASTTCLSHPVLVSQLKPVLEAAGCHWQSRSSVHSSNIGLGIDWDWRRQGPGSAVCQCQSVASECHGKADTDWLPLLQCPVSSAVLTLPVFGTDCCEQLPVVFCSPQCLLGGADIGVSVMWSGAWPGDRDLSPCGHHYLSHLNHHSSYSQDWRNN